MGEYYYAWHEAALERAAEHAYVPSGLRGVSRCACRMPFHGMPHAHRAHLAAEVVKALGLREESRCITTGGVTEWQDRLVTDWREVEPEW